MSPLALVVVVLVVAAGVAAVLGLAEDDRLNWAALGVLLIALALLIPALAHA